ncbi:MAG: ubiquinone/menaquinone biosynthesis methyltransferase [Bdellovibrionota bacterium]
MNKKREIIEIFSSISKRYDFFNNVISFGIHKFWEKRLIKKITLKKTYKNLCQENFDKENFYNEKKLYENALDLCTGTGALLKDLKRISKNLYAVDISKEMLSLAKERCKKQNIDVEFINSEAENLRFSDEFFDLIVVSYGVRNFYDLDKGLKEIRRTLKKDGIIYILEFGKQKNNNFWGKIFSFYFLKIMPLIIKVFCGNKKAYKYLSSSVLNFPSSKEFIEILSRNNLNCSHYEIMLGGFVYIYEITI